MKYALLTLVFVAILLTGYLFYTIYQQKVLLNIMVGRNETIGIIKSNATTSMFYDNMRFNSSRLFFYISDDCDDYKRERMTSALSMLENYTLLIFKESPN